MGKIHLLSPTLQNQIAAGEVVERPASIIKELLENAIDANATSLFLEIEEGGIKKIRSIDNGIGMSAEDAKMAFLRYATSKIFTVDDLFTLQSFGFRGEALASIASVSHMVLRTKREEDQIGTQVINGTQVSPCALEGGTEIVVENLFWNVPARRKFLKSPQTESREIAKIVEAFALANPKIEIRFLKDGKEVFHFFPSKGENFLAHRCEEVLGKSTAENFLPLCWEGQSEKISGFISHPHFHRSTREKQFLFVNGRIIQGDKIFSSALAQSYQTLLPNGKFPSCVIFITIPPEMVDVNVHPRKTQVKFQNPQKIFQMVKTAVISALEKSTKKIFSEHTPYKISPNANPFLGNSSGKNFLSGSSSSSINLQKNFPPSISSVPNTQGVFGEWESLEGESFLQEKKISILGQARNSFIVVASQEGIEMIDQHAAHERVRYEELLRDFRSKKIISQPLLTPVVLEISQSEKNLLLEKQDDLALLGFDIEDFGGNEIAVSSVPTGNTSVDIAKLFRDLLDDLDSFDPSFGEFSKNITQRMISYTACRGAVKFGDTLTLPEMEGLIKDLKNCSHPESCAHGRPVSTFLSYKSIENDCGR